MIAAIGLVVLVVSFVFLMAADARNDTQIILGALGVLIGIFLMLASLTVVLWRYAP